MMRSRTAAFAVLALLAGLAVLPPAAQAAAPTVVAFPGPEEVVRTQTPTFRVTVTDVDGDAELATLSLTVDGNVLSEDSENLVVNATGVSYALPDIFALEPGNHTLRVTVFDRAGAQAEVAYNFTVDLRPPPGAPVSLLAVLVLVGAGVAVLVGGGVAAYTYLHRTRRFTFRRHFLRNPQHIRYLALYLPAAAAGLLTLVGLFLAASLPHPPRFLAEYVLVAGGILAFAPFGIDTVRRTRRTRAAERAFSQFLFELADAVRGGIDPLKAVLEMAKSQDGLLRGPMQQAADSIRMGRPLVEALKRMTDGLGSSLVARYAALVGEASEMGGAIGGVIQRAARDMEEMVKIREERNRQMATPVMVMYMSFGVLLIMVIQLVSFAPTLGDIDLGVLAGGGDGPAKVPRIGADILQARMFHLVLLNAAGGGLLVGSFREGKLKHGILHAAAMVAVAALVYPLLVGDPTAAVAATTTIGR